MAKVLPESLALAVQGVLVFGNAELFNAAAMHASVCAAAQYLLTQVLPLTGARVYIKKATCRWISCLYASRLCSNM